MDNEEKNERIKQYTERHRFWTAQVLSQFGYTINLFTTIGIGFLGFLISTKNKYPEIIINGSMPIDWNLIFYLITLFFVFISVFFGAISIMSRLYDLRLTRHIIWVRKRVLSDLNKSLKNDFIYIEKESLVKAFTKMLWGKIDFIGIVENDKYEQIKLQFEKLRKQSKVLGGLSWKAHKIQTIILILSVLTYSLTIF